MAWQHRIGWQSRGLLLQSLHLRLQVSDLYSQLIRFVIGQQQESFLLFVLLEEIYDLLSEFLCPLSMYLSTSPQHCGNNSQP